MSQPEIKEFGSFFCEHDVCGLDITVTNAGPVRAIERVCYLDGVTDCIGRRNWPATEPVRQGFAFQVLHYEEVVAVVAPNIMKDADVWMSQVCDGPRFVLEPLAEAFAHDLIATV